MILLAKLKSFYSNRKVNYSTIKAETEDNENFQSYEDEIYSTSTNFFIDYYKSKMINMFVVLIILWNYPLSYVRFEVSELPRDNLPSFNSNL
ncbi:hypothetical protein CAEBREN_00756 [Caenorhabditis brenneri]|uniref:Uncharacterized protein n=1 Tax=Caenorhabditis brenneri TaxID=135651 RepID=G0MKI3_CAEBE|nr:hypothetical protein CAEBREN_00756 [Caenorhabditis brenneri]